MDKRQPQLQELLAIYLLCSHQIICNEIEVISENLSFLIYIYQAIIEKNSEESLSNVVSNSESERGGGSHGNSFSLGAMLSSEYEKGKGDWATDTRGGSEYSYSYLESLEKEDQEDTLSYYYDIEGIINRLTPLYSNMQYEGKQWTVAGFNGQPGLLTGSPDTIYDNLDDGVYIISRLKKDHEGKDPKQFWNRHDIILIKEGSSVEFWSFTPGLIPKTDKNGKIIYVYPTQKEIMKGVPGWIHKGNPLDSQSMNKGDIYKGYVQNKFYSIDITGLRSYLNNATGLNNKNAPIYNPFTYNCQSFAIDTILKYQKNFDIRNYLPFF